MHPPESAQSSLRLEQLLRTVEDAQELLIVPHNNPDPDAIASALALCFLLKRTLNIPTRIVYDGLIGRAENQALIHYLGYPMEHLDNGLLHHAEHIALIDTQPGTGNNPLPPSITPSIVIDHHPLRQASAAARFMDVRPDVGASASIMMEYLQVAQLPLTAKLATALFYGVKTDTQGLERGTTRCDHVAFCQLLSYVDLEALFRIESAQMPGDYFETLVLALQSASMYDHVTLSFVDRMSYPDMVASLADFLMRRQGCEWAICMGIYQSNLHISVRTNQKRGAGQLVQAVVGTRGSAGGHGSMAGGRIALGNDDPVQLADSLSQGFLEKLGVQTKIGVPFVHTMPVLNAMPEQSVQPGHR